MGGTSGHQFPVYQSFPPQETQYPQHPMPQHAVHSSPYYSDRHNPPPSSSGRSSPYTGGQTPTRSDLSSEYSDY